MKNIVDFYSGISTDTEGRTIHDIFKFNYEQLETIHDYIQWLFPLKEKSNFNDNAPLLTSGDIQVFRSDDVIKANVNKALRMMLDFYGFNMATNDANIKIAKNENYEERAKNWITPFNHNYLRITRILKFLTLAGMKNYAAAFFGALENVYTGNKKTIGRTTFAYWKNACR
ncbi:MAG: hypothetical protein LBJ31_04590 [Treponema sp.]|jgi:hypothetical protein|nr:hypothetical protein [Treponema sp.]